MKSVVDILKRAEVFLGLDDTALSRIAALPSCRVASYVGGQVFFRANDEAENIFILQDGEVRLVTEIPDKTGENFELIVIDKLTRGSFFGWSALTEPHRYVMSGVCYKPSTVVIIRGEDLLELFASDYYLGYKVYQYMSRIIGNRLRDMEQVLIKGERRPFFTKRPPRTV